MSLPNALLLGEPIQVYLDNAPPTEPYGECYQNLTSEWYHSAAVNTNIPESRLESRLAELEADVVDFEDIEYYAEYWLLER